MLKTVSGFFVRLAERWMPDPLVIAIALTLVCFSAALLLTPFTATQTIDAWGEGYWSLLRFTAQITLTLALGHVLAHTEAVKKGLVWIASFEGSDFVAHQLIDGPGEAFRFDDSSDGLLEPIEIFGLLIRGG